MDENVTPQVLRKQANWEDLYFYQKSVVLYQLTFVFTKHFLTKGDRTIDQMVQRLAPASRISWKALLTVSPRWRWN
jgi:hypothetical protein